MKKGETVCRIRKCVLERLWHRPVVVVAGRKFGQLVVGTPRTSGLQPTMIPR